MKVIPDLLDQLKILLSLLFNQEYLAILSAQAELKLSPVYLAGKLCQYYTEVLRLCHTNINNCDLTRFSLDYF